MSDLHFFDTNILIYSISGNPREASKCEQANTLLRQRGGALSVQVLQEFYVQATRASRPDRIPRDKAITLIRAWSRFDVQDVTMAVLEAALGIQARFGFSYWDSAVIAAASALGCRRLYSEDMTHTQVVDGVMIINPFVQR